MVEEIKDIEKHILRMIRHRLTVSCGRCGINVRSLAKAVARDARLIERGEFPPRSLYILVDDLLRAAGGVFWMHGYGGQVRKSDSRSPNYDNMRSAIASRVYTFDPVTAMEAMLAHV